MGDYFMDNLSKLHPRPSERQLHVSIYTHSNHNSLLLIRIPICILHVNNLFSVNLS